MRLKHVALHVPDLAAAEAFYAATFGMEVITLEVAGEDGVWRQAPDDVGWDELRSAGYEPSMVGLRRDDLIIALFPGQPQAGTVLLIGIAADEDEIAAVRATLADGVTIETDLPAALTFVDPHGFRWQIGTPGFHGAGEARGDWLDISD